MTASKGRQNAADALYRQWELLCAVPRHPVKRAASDLLGVLRAKGYAVTKRTVERDLQTLSGLFPLACDDRSKPFGWHWHKDAPLFDVPGLGLHEALAFQLVKRFLEPLLPESVLRRLAPHFAVAERVLSAGGGASPARSWTNKVRVVHPGQVLLPPRLNRDIYPAVTEAVLLDQKLKVSYRRKGERKTVRYTLNPLAIVQRGPVTYLVATVNEHNEPLLFAVHRLEAAERLETPARAVRFNLDDYIASGKLGFGEGKRIRLEAVFSDDAVEHLRETPLGADQILTPLGEGRTRLRASVVDTPQLLWWLLGFGDGVEVVRPESLRRVVRDNILASARRYRVR